MKNTLFLGALTALVPGVASAVTILDNIHADIGFAYEDDAWNLHVHDETDDIEYAPDDVILYLNELTATTVPSNPDYGFLGNPGDPVWILTQSHIPGTLNLGLGAEEIPDGLFSGNTITIQLDTFAGTGDFFLYQTDSFGDPVIFFDTSDGIDASDSLIFPTGGHVHFNFAFTGTGVKTVGLSASGTLVEGSIFTDSGTVDYQFGVLAVPEPATFALLAGLAALGIARRRGRA